VERLPLDKRSSLFGLAVSDKERIDKAPKPFLYCPIFVRCSPLGSVLALAASIRPRKNPKNPYGVNLPTLFVSYNVAVQQNKDF